MMVDVDYQPTLTQLVSLPWFQPSTVVLIPTSTCNFRNLSPPSASCGRLASVCEGLVQMTPPFQMGWLKISASKPWIFRGCILFFGTQCFLFEGHRFLGKCVNTNTYYAYIPWWCLRGDFPKKQTWSGSLRCWGAYRFHFVVGNVLGSKSYNPLISCDSSFVAIYQAWVPCAIFFPPTMEVSFFF